MVNYVTMAYNNNGMDVPAGYDPASANICMIRWSEK